MKKRLITAILTLALSAGLLAGCGGAQKEEAASSASETAASSAASSVSAGSDADVNALESASDVAGTVEDQDAVNASQMASGGASGGSGAIDASFVMIYNPKLFDEIEESMMALSSLNTGDLSSQIITGMNRAGDLGSGINPESVISQSAYDVDLGETNRSGAKAGGLDPVYRVGDSHDFYHFTGMMTARSEDTFDCIYAGEHCYIWSLDGSIDDASAEEFGKEFDEVIYQKDVDAFGPGRFTENGGKVNMLFYPMQQGIGGLFCIYDIFSGTEVSEEMRVSYGMNTDHAIISVNSDMIGVDNDFVKSTLAHEFQHQICASDYFYTNDTPKMRTWLNEAMSAYAEEMVYPGIKEAGEYNLMMYASDSYRKGQSLYNFATDNDEYIGAYGAVYLFSQYLSQHAGDDIFAKVHEYWRSTSEHDKTEANCLASVVPASFKKEIDEKYTFPQEVAGSFANDNEEWLSKLALDFFIETLSGDLAQMKEYEDNLRAVSLYTEVNPQDVEGGGRMLVATESGRYTIPDDADEGLLYIGLDQDFNVITEPVAG
ncbi:MAG: hypothetical protein IJI10_02565 [Eubacterium sp.]|nr:hypothetical protein [Eubacterium sp.]